MIGGFGLVEDLGGKRRGRAALEKGNVVDALLWRVGGVGGLVARKDGEILRQFLQ